MPALNRDEALSVSLVAASALVLLPVTTSPSHVSLVLARQRRTAHTLNTSPRGRKPKFLKSRPRKVGALAGNSTRSTQTVHGEEEKAIQPIGQFWTQTHFTDYFLFSFTFLKSFLCRNTAAVKDNLIQNYLYKQKCICFCLFLSSSCKQKQIHTLTNLSCSCTFMVWSLLF